MSDETGAPVPRAVSDEAAAPVPRSEAQPVARDRLAVEDAVSVTSHFKMIFLTICSFVVLLLAVEVGLVVFAEQTDAVKNVVATCDALLKIGLGSIFGLMGGKVAG